MENILKYLFPQKCIFCGSVGDIFCETCLGECSLLNLQCCVLCDKPSCSGWTHEECLTNAHEKSIPSRTVCVFSYQGKVRDCIKFSKYGARQFLSLRRLSKEAADLAFESWGSLNVDVCLPVPSSPAKLSVRGFNQANMVAEEVARRFRLELRKDLLMRSRSTQAMHSQSREERKANVKGSFKVVGAEYIKGKRILVIDDICTTGATFLESAKVLYEAGAADVQCFALSKREKFCYNSRA